VAVGRLGGFSVGRDWWGGERIVGGVVPRINIDTWGLCDRLLGHCNYIELIDTIFTDVEGVD
jgi:hypothetical protein